jgi:drug/metabolite transporter (DMT)-like permease
MLKLVFLSTVQSLFLVASQVFLKLAVAKMGSFNLSVAYLKLLLTNWQFACSGICIASATILWMYILKHFEFNMAYPMISISYVFGMFAAMFIFHETVPLNRWIGIIFILIGVLFVAKQ